MRPLTSAAAALRPPTRKQGPLEWSLESIRKALDAQLRGQFDLPVRLAEAFRSDDALFSAFIARVATQSAIKLDWRPSKSANGVAVCDRARTLVLLPQHIRESILGTLANHGIAIGYVKQEAVDTEAGPSLKYELSEWPLEHVRYVPTDGTLLTRTVDMQTVPIVHGDGRWIVFRKFGFAPWTQDACLLPAGLLWAAHAYGLQDWASASSSHGQPKFIATLAEGLTLAQADGTLSPEAQALLDVLQSLVSGDAGAGVLPATAKAELLTNGSTAWQVFEKLILNRERAAQRIYCGTDAALGAQGGAPGVDVASLFGIASTRIQGDFEALERGYAEGVTLPWCRAHGVPFADIPAAVYEMPDTDGDRRSEQEAAAITRLAEALKALRDAQMEVTQDTVNALVQVLGVSVTCTLAAQETRAVPIELAPTDKARVVKVREARASMSLPELGDERDELFIAELEQKAEADAAAANPPPSPDGAGAPADDTEAPPPPGDAPAEE